MFGVFRGWICFWGEYLARDMCLCIVHTDGIYVNESLMLCCQTVKFKKKKDLAAMDKGVSDVYQGTVGLGSLNIIACKRVCVSCESL